MSSGKIKPIPSGNTMTVVLLHPNLGIEVGIDGYQNR